MSTQHTKGPWKVKTGSNAVLAGRKQICSHVNAASVLPVNMVEDQKIAEANARLIAAAPDLLEALQEITSDYADRFDLDDPSTNPGIKSSIEQARAAIAKATGAT